MLVLAGPAVQGRRRPRVHRHRPVSPGHAGGGNGWSPTTTPTSPPAARSVSCSSTAKRGTGWPSGRTGRTRCPGPSRAWPGIWPPDRAASFDTCAVTYRTVLDLRSGRWPPSGVPPERRRAGPPTGSVARMLPGGGQPGYGLQPSQGVAAGTRRGRETVRAARVRWRLSARTEGAVPQSPALASGRNRAALYDLRRRAGHPPLTKTPALGIRAPSCTPCGRPAVSAKPGLRRPGRWGRYIDNRLPIGCEP